jgi:hypothetical protein
MISVNLTGIEAARQALGPVVVNKAINSTLNKLAAKAKTEVSKEIRKTYNIKARDLNAQLTVSRARGAGFYEATLSASGPRFSLMYFDPQEIAIRGGDAILTSRARGRDGSGGLVSRKVKRGSRVRGVTVKVKHAGGRKLVKGPKGYGGFLAQGRRGQLGGGAARALFNRSEAKQGRGNYQIFMRQGKERFPIDKLTGPAVAQMLGKKASVVQDVINRDAARLFQHEFDFFSRQVRRG